VSEVKSADLIVDLPFPIGEAWKIKELARESEVSLGLASNVKKLLEDREWVRKTDDGLVLVEPEKLLAEWAENYSFRKNKVRDFHSTKPVAELESDLAAACRERGVPYALTGFSAASPGRGFPMSRSTPISWGRPWRFL